MLLYGSRARSCFDWCLKASLWWCSVFERNELLARTRQVRSLRIHDAIGPRIGVCHEYSVWGYSCEARSRIVALRMRLSHSFSGALRTFAYFMASGTQNSLEGIEYLSLYGEEPSAIERVFAIYANVIELDAAGTVLNAKYAEKRATDSLRAYCDPTFVVSPPYADWELELHDPPPLRDPASRR